jgi:cytochrome c
MKAIAAILAVAGALSTGAVLAQGDVLKAKGCMNCHAVDAKKAGPSFKDIAAKNKADSKAALVAKLKDGKGHMKVNASEAELNDAVGQILSTK